MNSWKTRNGQSVTQVLRGRSNAFVISNGAGRFFLVDTGREKQETGLFKALEELGATGEVLAAVLLTHVHFDHVENCAEIKRQYGSAILVHKDEAHYLASGDNAMIGGTIPITRVVARVFRSRLRNHYRYRPVTADHLVDGRYDLAPLGFDAYVIHTPGHTAGSLSLIVGQDVAIVGDALFGVFKGSVLPPYGSDLPRMVRSWGQLLDTGASVFLPGHGTADDRDLVEEQYEKYRRRLGF